MKKMICVMLAVLMLLPVFATTAVASGHGHGHHSSCVQVNNQNCVNDKTCVYNETCVYSCDYTDENGDNICDSCGKCSHHRDDNRDGTCDHQAECANRKNAVCNNTGKRSGYHGRKHRNHH